MNIKINYINHDDNLLNLYLLNGDWGLGFWDWGLGNGTIP